MNKPTKRELYSTVKQLENQIEEQRKMYEQVLKEFEIEFKTETSVSHLTFGAHIVKTLYVLGDKRICSAFHVKDEYLHLYTKE